MIYSTGGTDLFFFSFSILCDSKFHFSKESSSGSEQAEKILRKAIHDEIKEVVEEELDAIETETNQLKNDNGESTNTKKSSLTAENKVDEDLVDVDHEEDEFEEG